MSNDAETFPPPSTSAKMLQTDQHLVQKRNSELKERSHVLENSTKPETCVLQVRGPTSPPLALPWLQGFSMSSYTTAR